MREIRTDDKFKQIPLILVGTKSDEFDDHDILSFRTDSENHGGHINTEGNTNPLGESSIMAPGDRRGSSMRGREKKVSKEQGEKTASFEGFIKYIETSALFGEGVKNVFDEAVHAIMKDQTKYSKNLLAELNSKGKKGNGADSNKKCLIF